MNKKTNSGKKANEFFSRYKNYIVVTALIATAVYILLYLFFMWDGPFPIGKGLDKSDWLSFFGAYLSFVGTTIVSLIAILQSEFYNTAENQRRMEDRRKEIQPIFSVRIKEMNTSPPGTIEAISVYSTIDATRHRNISLAIENAGTFPATHVIVFDKYLQPVLNSKESLNICCAYWDTDDAKEYPNKVTVLSDEFERDEKGRPKWFNINYEDVDGNAMFQTFELKDFDGTFYYSLESIESA